MPRIASVLLLSLASFFICVSNGARAANIACTAGYSCISIDNPLARGGGTWLSGVNDSGETVGWYADVGGGRHGFFFDGINFNPLDVPASLGSNTSPMGINNSNQIVGYYYDANGMHGFLFDGALFSSLDAGISSGTMPTAINNSNVVIGGYANQGFYEQRGTLNFFAFPGASVTVPRGVNDLNHIVGSYSVAGSDAAAFVEANNSFSSVTFNGYEGTYLGGIDDNDVAVGNAFGNIYRGFSYQSGNFQLFDILLSSGTYVTSTNSFGQLVGWYFDLNSPNLMHGFLATPASTTPVMLFNGYDYAGVFQHNINITGTTQRAVVGQQISLIASVPGSIQSEQWFVQGKPVGGYTPTEFSHQTGTVLPWTSSNPSTKFYWTIPSGAKGYVVEYSYVMANGQSGMLEARFSVAGPEDATVAVVTTNPGEVYDNRSGSYPGYPTPWILSCGIPGDNSHPCFEFKGTANIPDGYQSSAFQWVQIVEQTTTQFFDNGPPQICSIGPALDNTYPYLAVLPTGDPIDAPGNGMKANDPARVLANKTSARMYLMWTSGLKNAIPVSLGYIAWAWTDAAKQRENGAWQLKSKILSYPSFAAFVAAARYPTWSSTTLNGFCS